MYEYKSSLAVQTHAGSIFASPDLKDELIASVYMNYFKVYLVLTHPSTEDTLYLNLEDVADDIALFTGTVAAFLVANGDRALPTTPVAPSINVRYAAYTELSRAGYSLVLTNEGQNYPTGMDRNAMFDVGVSRSDLDMMNVQATSLVSINGYIHDSIANSNTLYVRKGAVTARIANTYAAGLLTFMGIGELTRYKLKAEDITQFDSQIPVSSRIRFKVPDFDKGKPYFLVMGGYLIFPREGQFFQVEEDSFTLDLDSFNYVERLLESARFIDLRDLKLTEPVNMDGEGWIVSELKSLEVIRRYLTLSQSFLVSVDAPNLTINKEVVSQELYPNRYLVSKEPVHALMGGHGRLIEYWPRETNFGYQLETGDNQRNQFLHSQYAPTNPQAYVDQTPDILERHRLSGAYFLEIQSTL